MLTSITNRLGADPVPAKWNCGGSKFTECIGCGAQVKTYPDQLLIIINLRLAKGGQKEYAQPAVFERIHCSN